MTMHRAGSNMTELEFDGGWMALISNGRRVACYVDGTYYRTSKWWGQETLEHINRWTGGRHTEVKSQDYFDGLKDD